MVNITLATLGPSALCGVFVLLMFTGRIRPASAFHEQRRNYERQLEDANHDRDEWRAAHRISETARLESAEQVGKLILSGNTSEHLLASIASAVGKGGGRVEPI